MPSKLTSARAMPKISAIDFFCGVGGTTRGFLDAGIDVVRGFDIDSDCQAAYSHNNTQSQFCVADVRTLTSKDALRGIKKRKGELLLFSGCAPCQPFSKLARAKREGGNLLEAFGRLVEECSPDLIFVENVPGIQRVRGRSTFSRFIRRLSANGYHFIFDVINAADYGVPQNRARLILIAAKGLPVSFPPFTHGPQALHPYPSVRSAIGHYPPLKAGECHPIIPNHRAMNLSEMNLRRLKATPSDGGDRRAWPTELTLACHARLSSGHTDVYGRMRWGQPAPTLTGRCVSVSNGRFAHPVQHRGLSLREAAALQTFSDDFQFFGPMASIAQQIGNAVPVRLAQMFGEHFHKIAKRI